MVPGPMNTWYAPPPKWLDRLLRPWLPRDPRERFRLRVRVFRVLAVATLVLGMHYFVFRYTRTVNVAALWFALPLLLAETYSFIGTWLFVMTLWKPTRRTPPPPPQGAAVDVFITTYDEPLEIIEATARAAVNIRYPHRTYILDDGNRPEVRALAQRLGCGYITRGPEWEGKPRHAKAGNINNALMQTSGEFILFLDADQIPAPHILDRTLGYFRDPQVAFVQTPQFFYNVPEDDPFGSQAPLFYGPIQQGKDGWNAAFFCGTNAVFRREALMHLGVLRYVRLVEARVLAALGRVAMDLRLGRRPIPHRYRRYARRVAQAAETALAALRRREPLAQVLSRFNAAIEALRREIVLGDLRDIVRTLAEIEALDTARQPQRAPVEALARPQWAGAHVAGVQVVRDVRLAIEQGMTALAERLARFAPPPAQALGLDEETERLLALELGEALEVNPVDTLTVTEDMATSLQLHALGWKSVFHPEILAYGRAPEDLGSALKQRFRWAVGTLQVFLHYNPLTYPGLTWGQRLQYFMTIYSYFSGFATLVYLLSPVVYLLTGIPPVTSFTGEFLLRLAPYLAMNWLMFYVAAWGRRTLRGEQYNLALFPVWIQAALTVFGGRRVRFQVTPKTRREGVYLHLVWPQLTVLVLLVLSSLYAVLALALGWRHDTTGVLVNLAWAVYDVFMLHIIVRAALYRPQTADRRLQTADGRPRAAPWYDCFALPEPLPEVRR